MLRGPAALLGALVLGLAPLALGIGAASAAAPASGEQPTVQTGVTASPPSGAPGATIAVNGVGWPAGSLISVWLCGNQFLNGTSDCAPTAANTATTTPTGTFFTEIVVALPPTPCPCVIHASSPDTTVTVNQLFDVVGAATAPPTQVVLRRDVDVSGSLTGSGPWTAWFGGDAKRTYTLTVKNTGTTPLLDPPITVAVGEGEDPTEIVARPKLGEIAVGEEATTTIPITLDGPTFGRSTVKTIVSGIDVPVAISDSTASYPWGLFVLGWLIIQVPLLGLYRRRRLDGPDDPLDREFAALLLPTRDYGVDSVRDFVEPRSIVVDEDDAGPKVIVSSGGGPSHARRRSRLLSR